MSAIDKLEPLVLSVRETKHLTGLCDTTIWKLRKAGLLKDIKIPGVEKTLIDYQSVKALMIPSEDGPGGRPRGIPKSGDGQGRRKRGRPRKKIALASAEVAA